MKYQLFLMVRNEACNDFVFSKRTWPKFQKNFSNACLTGLSFEHYDVTNCESLSSVRQKTFVNHLSAVQFVFRMHK